MNKFEHNNIPEEIFGCREPVTWQGVALPDELVRAIRKIIPAHFDQAMILERICTMVATPWTNHPNLIYAKNNGDTVIGAVLRQFVHDQVSLYQHEDLMTYQESALDFISKLNQLLLQHTPEETITPSLRISNAQTLADTRCGPDLIAVFDRALGRKIAQLWNSPLLAETQRERAFEFMRYPLRMADLIARHELLPLWEAQDIDSLQTLADQAAEEYRSAQRLSLRTANKMVSDFITALTSRKLNGPLIEKIRHEKIAFTRAAVRRWIEEDKNQPLPEYMIPTKKTHRTRSRLSQHYHEGIPPLVTETTELNRKILPPEHLALLADHFLSEQADPKQRALFFLMLATGRPSDWLLKLRKGSRS